MAQCVPTRWLTEDGAVVAYQDGVGNLHVRDAGGNLVLLSEHSQVGGQHDWMGDWTPLRDDYGLEEPDDPVLASIVLAIPDDINAIYILTQRLAHILAEMGTTRSREVALARTKLQEAAHWLGSAIHAMGLANDR